MAQLWQDFMDAPGYFNHSPWFPNPFIAGRDMAIYGYAETVNRLPWRGVGVWLQETQEWVDKSVVFDLSCITMPLFVAVLLTMLRLFLTWALYKVSILCVGVFV